MVLVIDVVNLIDKITKETDEEIVKELLHLSSEYNANKKNASSHVIKFFIYSISKCFILCPSKRQRYSLILNLLSQKIKLNILNENYIPILLKRLYLEQKGDDVGMYNTLVRIEESFAFGDLIPNYYDFLGKQKYVFEGNKKFTFRGVFPGSILDLIIDDNIEKVADYYSVNSTTDPIDTCFLHELMGMKIIKYQSPLDACAHYCSIKCFRFLLLSGCEVTVTTVKCAIYGGNIEIIRLCEQTGILDKNIYALKEALNAAIDTSQLYLIKWIEDSYNIHPTNDMWKNAFSLIKMEQPKLNDSFYSDRMIAADISSGNFEVVERELKYRESINAPMTFDLTNFAYKDLDKIAEIIRKHSKSFIYRICVNSSPLLLAKVEDIVINYLKSNEDIEYSTNPFTAIILARHGF